MQWSLVELLDNLLHALCQPVWLVISVVMIRSSALIPRFGAAVDAVARRFNAGVQQMQCLLQLARILIVST